MGKKATILIFIGIILMSYGIVLIISINFLDLPNPSSEPTHIIERKRMILTSDTGDQLSVVMNIYSDKSTFQNEGNYLFTLSDTPFTVSPSIFVIYDDERIGDKDSFNSLLRQKLQEFSDNNSAVNVEKDVMALSFLHPMDESSLHQATFTNLKLLGGSYSIIITVTNEDETELYSYSSDDVIFSMPSFEEELQLITNKNSNLQIQEQRVNNLIIQGLSWILVGAIPLEIGSRFYKKD